MTVHLRIIGGGLAGLSLASLLCDEKFAALKVEVCERRTTYQRDRTWSAWTHASHPAHIYSSCARKSWTSWTVASEDRTLQRSAPGWRYVSWDADAVYACAIARITSSERVRLITGVGSGFTARAAPALLTLDASGQRDPSGAKAATLVQHFKGIELHCEQAVFDAQTVELMHFTPTARGLHFQYLLPYDPHTALLEDTWISPPDKPINYDADLDATLHRRWPGLRFDRRYSEQGVLPLHTQPTIAKPWAIGIAGGALRASTGYAFLNTIAQCEAMARHLHTHLPTLLQGYAPPAPTLPGPTRRDTWMDAVLFDAMQRHWQQAPQYFMHLFERTPADALLRFLTGTTDVRWIDRLRVMSALPLQPFARAAWRVLHA